MNLIASADRNWAIGYQNKLLVRIPTDMKFFREKTVGKVIVMGRKTLESFPNGLPLKQRTNVVLTSNRQYKAKDAVVVHTMEELQEELKKYDSQDIFVVGGESIYRQLEPCCDVAYITKIDRSFQADTYFPNLDQIEGWRQISESEEYTCFDLEYRFVRYEKEVEITFGDA